MQNKPNLPDAQMNVNSLLTKDYENETTCAIRKYKPNQSRFLYKQLNLLFIIPGK